MLVQKLADRQPQKDKKKVKVIAAGIIIGATLLASGIAFAKPVSGLFSQLSDNKKASGDLSKAKGSDEKATDPLASLLKQTDGDNDGLTDAEEFSIGTDPTKKDTDGDGYTDKVEVDSKHDPLKKPEAAATVDASDPAVQKEVGDLIDKYAQQDGSSLSNESINKLLSDFENTSGEEFVLPEIPAEDIHVVSNAPIEPYLKQVDQVVSKNAFFDQADAFQSLLTQLVNADNRQIEDAKLTFGQTYTDLKDISVPQDGVDFHKKALGFVKGIQDILTQLESEKSSDNVDSFIKSFSKFKSVLVIFQSLSQDFIALAKSHNVDISKF